MSRFTANFETIDTTSGGNRALPELLRMYSKLFVVSVTKGEIATRNRVSHDAWGVMRQLALVIRHAQDAGHIANVPLDTGCIVTNLTAGEQQAMLGANKVDRQHVSFSKLPLRDCLNKIAHPERTGYRIDGRGSHYLVISGRDQRPNRGPWVAEFNVRTMADHCQNVIEQLP